MSPEEESQQQPELRTSRSRLGESVERNPFTWVYGMLIAVLCLAVAISKIADYSLDFAAWTIAITPLVATFLGMTIVHRVELPEDETRKLVDAAVKLVLTFTIGSTLGAIAHDLNVSAALITPGFYVATIVAIASFGMFVDGANAVIFGMQTKRLEAQSE